MSMGSIGRNLPRIKEVNQFLIRENIYRNGPVSRNDVAKNLALTLPTITTNISNMLDQGLLREIPVIQEQKTLGRHTMLVDYVPGSRLFLGLEIRDGICRAELVDIRGNVVTSSADDNPADGYDEMLRSAVRTTEKILDSCNLDMDRISAVGLCVPAFRWNAKKAALDFAVKTGYRGGVYTNTCAVARAYGLSLFGYENIKNIP